MKKAPQITGLDFEHSCARVLRSKGFTNVKVTRGSGDQGADILAQKHGLKYAVQCKYYTNPVGNKAVQEAHAGKAYYHCDRSMVMTNTTFTQSAKNLAQATGTELWEHVSPSGATLSFRGVMLALIFLEIILVLKDVSPARPFLISFLVLIFALYLLIFIAEAKSIVRLKCWWGLTGVTKTLFVCWAFLYLIGVYSYKSYNLQSFTYWLLSCFLLVGASQLITSVIPHSFTLGAHNLKEFFVSHNKENKETELPASDCLSPTVQPASFDTGSAPAVLSSDSTVSPDLPPFETASFHLQKCEPLLVDAIEVVVETGMASVSMLQRRLRLGYSQAAKLMEQMEEIGIVGPIEGSKPRKVLITKEQWADSKLHMSAPSVECSTDTVPKSVPDPESVSFIDSADYRVVRDLESKMVDAYSNCGNTDIDAAIASLRTAMNYATQIESICNKTEAGQTYFSNMWLHCHNARNSDFSYIQQIQDRLDDMIFNYDELKEKYERHRQIREAEAAFAPVAEVEIFTAISEHPGILQKDLYTLFAPELKNSISLALRNLVKAGRVEKIKSGKSFELWTK